MKNRHYSFLLYLISAVIVVTLAIQLYWNYKNYQAGKQQLTNDIQASFTNALDAYYLNQEKENTISIYSKGDLDVLNLKNIINQLKISDQRIKGVDSLVISKAKKSLEIYKGKPIQTQAYTQSDSSGEDAKISTSIVISVSKDSL